LFSHQNVSTSILFFGSSLGTICFSLQAKLTGAVHTTRGWWLPGSWGGGWSWSHGDSDSDSDWNTEDDTPGGWGGWGQGISGGWSIGGGDDSDSGDGTCGVQSAMHAPCSYALIIGNKVVDIKMDGSDSTTRDFQIEHNLPVVVTTKSFCTSWNDDPLKNTVLGSFTICGQKVSCAVMEGYLTSPLGPASWKMTPLSLCWLLMMMMMVVVVKNRL